MTELDDRIRETMSRVAAAAPDPPRLGDVRWNAVSTRSRRVTFVAAASIAVVVVVVALFLSNTATGPRQVTARPGPTAPSAPLETPSPTTSPQSTPTRMRPDQVLAALRVVTGASPVLVPSAALAGWTADLTAAVNTFSLTYLGPVREQIQLSIAVPNPPPPTTASTQRILNFRGDAHSVYQAQNRADPGTIRFLVWNEPGHWAGDPNIANSARTDSVPYFLMSNGVGEAQFWAFANSLHPVPNSSGTITSTDPAKALDALVAGLPADHASSGLVHTVDGDLAAISFNETPPAGGTYPHVQIRAFQDGGWTKLVDITLDIGGAVMAPATNATPITVVHLTGSATPDFAVLVNYNDGPAAAIVTKAGGMWQTLPFTDGSHSQDEVINPTFTASGVASRVNTCTPTCSAGNFRTINYRYSPRTRTMTSAP